MDQGRIAMADATDGSRLRLASVWPYEGRNGELFWGVLPELKCKSCVVNVAFPKSGFLYDLASGRFVGEGSNFKLSLSPNAPYAFELLPARPTPLSLAVDGATVRISCSPKVDTVVRTKIFNPLGEEVWYYTRKQIVRGGKATLTVPFAKSDAKGTWRVEATDVVTGSSASATLTR